MKPDAWRPAALRRWPSMVLLLVFASVLEGPESGARTGSSISGEKFSDDKLRSALEGASPELRSVDLSFSPELTDKGLAPLRRFKGLRRVKLDGCRQITDAGLAHLAGLEELRQLDLRRTGVTNAGLARLVKLKHLQRLSLSHTRVTDAGLAHLRGLQSLVSLELEGCQVNGSGLAHLRRLERLVFVELEGCPITDQALAHLTRLVSLRQLNLEHCSLLTDAALSHLKARRPQLVLSLRGCNKITDAGIRGLQAALSRCQIWRSSRERPLACRRAPRPYQPDLSAKLPSKLLRFEGLRLSMTLAELAKATSGRGWWSNAEPDKPDQRVRVRPPARHAVRSFKLVFERGRATVLTVRYRTPDPRRALRRRQYPFYLYTPGRRGQPGSWAMTDAGRQTLVMIDEAGGELTALHAARAGDRREVSAIFWQHWPNW